MITQSYRNFRFGIARTKKILELGIFGIVEERKKVTDLIKKIDSAQPIHTQISVPSRDTPIIRGEGDKKTIDIMLSEVEIGIVKAAVAGALEFTDELNFHLHGILSVSLWSNFETYVQGLLKEIYNEHPGLLESDRTMTIKQVVEGLDNMIEHLTEQEIAHVGSLNLAEMFKYLKRKILYDFSTKHQAILFDLYFVRNVFAHNSGFVRTAQLGMVPSEIPVVDGQIKIPQSYLLSSTESVELAIDEVEKYVLRRWFDTEVTSLDSPDAYVRLKGASPNASPP